MKRIIALILVCLMVFSLAGCQQKQAEKPAVEDMNWDAVLENAKGTTVNLYGWGGSDLTNTWLDTELGGILKEKYNITLNRVPMNIDEILAKMVSEKQAGAEGTIDVVWINGENFYTAKKNALLYGPFTDKLPNFSSYVEGAAPDIANDFGYPVEGFEAPYGKAQFVMIGDSAKIGALPMDHQALLALAKAHPGKITYPAPPDFTGSAFVRNLIYDVVGYESFMTVKPEKEAVKALIQPALDYMIELKPYLWREGKTYPATNALVDQMYSDGELYVTMNYNPNYVANKIASGEFSSTSVADVFEKGSIGNTHFLAIPANAPNKPAALALINAVLSPELQASKYDTKQWGDLPVLDESKLSPEQQKLFTDVPVGPGVPALSRISTRRLPEMPSNLVPIIEEIWMETIPEKGE